MLSGIKVYYNGLPKSGKVKFVLTFPFLGIVFGFAIGIIVISDYLRMFFKNLSSLTDKLGQDFSDRLGDWYDPTDE